MAQSDAEHFCTIFDSNFLPLGMTMAATLRRHCPQAVLWVICLDDAVHQQLGALDLPGVRPIALREVETDALRAVKPLRSRAEYSWTLTPFACAAVFAREPNAPRATYLDADLAFFDSPLLLIDEMVDAGRDVLITDHAFAPEYAQGVKHGRFCVQFMTFNHTDAAGAVMHRWQQQVLDWCYARLEDGRFGDQAYLNTWPDDYPHTVHVLEQTHRTLAPWNVSHIAETRGRLDPVIYHFHGLRFVTATRVRLYSGYRINAEARKLYDRYLDDLRQSVTRLAQAGIATGRIPLPTGLRHRAERFVQRLRGLEAFATVRPESQ